MTNRTVLYILPDETKNAGEADYAYALALALRGNEADDSKHIAFKIASEESLLKESGMDITGSAHVLPVTSKEFAQVAPYHAGVLEALGENPVTVIGVGNSTLATLKDIEKNHPNKNIGFSYITHMVDNGDDVEWLASNKANLFAPIDMKALKELNSTASRNVHLHTLNSVPHTNTLEACYVDYARFGETDNGQLLKEQMSVNGPVAFSVINAGFGIEDNHHPYREDQAYSHGFALGKGLEVNTMLLAAHGGPRNLKDENEFGQKTMDKYAEGYLAAQHEKGGNPVVIKEAFAFGLPYNVIKAGYLLAQAPNCNAFISNAEGYGTMDGALRLIDKDHVLTGMFPFNALYADPSGQRQTNIQKYHEAGIKILSNEDSGLKIFHSIGSSKQSNKEENPALKIIQTLNLGKQAEIKHAFNFAAPSF